MAIEFKDYYEILGVERAATDDEIRKSFRKLARKYHPDVAEDKASAEERFKEINEAYEVLGDPEKRQKYDTLGSQWKQYEGGYQSPPHRGGFAEGPFGGNAHEYHFTGTGFSDFFEQFFGMRGSRSAGYEGFSSRGQDIEADIMVTLDEVYNGSQRVLRLRKPAARNQPGEERSIKVRVPKGVQEGQLLRVPGYGEQGAGGGEPGDLFLHIRIARHADFRIRGSDLFYDLELAPWEAVLGAKIPIKTPKATVKVNVPGHTGAGEELIMRGLGLPKPDGTFGDLHAITRIVVPTHISASERTLWEALRDESNLKPRRIET